MSNRLLPRFSHVTFLHGKGELPDGPVAHLEAILALAYPEVTFARPLIPDLPTDEAGEWVMRYGPNLKPKSLLVGMGRGGLLACALRGIFPVLDLYVFAVNAPTKENSLAAQSTGVGFENRVCALYSSAYPPIKGRCEWAAVSPLAFDVPWLTQGVDSYYPISYLIASYLRGQDMRKEVSMLFPATV